MVLKLVFENQMKYIETHHLNDLRQAMFKASIYDDLLKHLCHISN